MVKAARTCLSNAACLLHCSTQLSEVFGNGGSAREKQQPVKEGRSIPQQASEMRVHAYA